MAWNGYPAGTIVAIRPSAPVQVIAVFDEWTIDAAGQLTRTPSAPATTQPPHVPPKISAAALTAAVTAVSPGQTFADTVLPDQLRGPVPLHDGPARSGPASASLLSGFAQQAVDGAFSSGPGLIDAFKQLLQANRIKLENDLAGAVILNYRDNAEIHYRDAWLDQVMNPPDPAAKDIKDKVAKLEDFADKITTDFDGTSDLFTAVDTMRVPDPQPGDVHDVTEAMLKAEGFFYMANVALTLGRQAFNAKYTMDGSDAAAKIAWPGGVVLPDLHRLRHRIETHRRPAGRHPLGHVPLRQSRRRGVDLGRLLRSRPGWRARLVGEMLRVGRLAGKGRDRMASWRRCA